MSLGAPLVAGIAALDGVFVACRRAAAAAVAYDAATFDGFHLYDLNFTPRAPGRIAARRRVRPRPRARVKGRLRGRVVAVRGALPRPPAPGLAAAQGSPHFYAARVPSADDVLAMPQRRLAEIAAG